MPLYPTRRLILLFLISSLTLLALFYFSPSSQQLRLYPYPISRVSPILDYSQISAKDYLSQRFKLLAAHQPLDYERSLEAETARCPLTHLQSNQDQLKGDGQGCWKRVSVEELVEARQKVIDRVKETVHQRGVGELVGNGQRGLVFTAGNGDTLNRLLVSLKILRHHGCQLPVEIFGFKNELESIQTKTIKRDIDSIGNVTWRPLELVRAEGAWKQFHIKGEAIASSSFSEILYLDSDNIVVTDPTFLFDSPVYREHGIVLWPDFNRDAAANPIWRLLDETCDPLHWQVETGQILIDKRARNGLNGIAMEIVKEMNREHEFWFKLSGGDKDTFRYGFYFLDLPFSLAPHYPSSVGDFLPKHQIYEGHTFCGHTMLQYSLSTKDWNQSAFLKFVKNDTTSSKNGRSMDVASTENHAPPLFVHANLLKYSGSWNQRGSTFRTIKKPRQDDVNSATLSKIRQTGFPVRGICADVWSVSATEEDSLREDFINSRKGEIETIGFGRSFSGVLREFEEIYWKFGGRTGGF
ncbi:hypothetical protein JCM5350_006530 [Sporobolomyces pararoseus]